MRLNFIGRMGEESKGMNDLEAECRRKEKMPKVKG